MENNKRPIVDVMVVAYNRPDYLKQCIAGIVNDAPLKTIYNWRLLVTDNSDLETDEGRKTRTWLVAQAKKGVIDKLLLSRENEGWARGFNSLLGICEAEWVLSVDCDAVFINRDWWRMIEDFHALGPNTDVGVMSPRCKEAVTREKHVVEKYNDFTLGIRSHVAVAHLVRYDILEKLGGLTDFGGKGGWGSETDLCLRLKKELGLRSALHLGVDIEHLATLHGNTPEYQEIRDREKAVGQKGFDKKWKP